MVFVNEQGYVSKLRRKGEARVRARRVFLVRSGKLNGLPRGWLYMGKILLFPAAYIGRRVTIKVEVVENDRRRTE